MTMNVTLSLDDRVVKEVRKIAVERDTTLTGLVREYLEKLVADHAASGRKCVNAKIWNTAKTRAIHRNRA